jgi:hypothetical protein
MALRTIQTAIAGLLSLQQYESDFKPAGIGAPNLTRDEQATVSSVRDPAVQPRTSPTRFRTSPPAPR